MNTNTSKSTAKTLSGAARGAATRAATVLDSSANYTQGRRAWSFLFAMFLISALCQIDRMLPFILGESIKRDLGLSDTQLGIITGVAFAVCHSLMSLPMARVADRGSPRKVLALCLLVWSTMTALGGFASSTLTLALTRFGVAIGEAGAIPSGHALIAREIPPERRGTAIGIFSLGIPIGAMVGFGVGGWVNDAYGWRAALLGAGLIGWLFLLMIPLAVRATKPFTETKAPQESFIRSSLKLLTSPVFRWLFIAANAVGFATAPFYAFATPFLIRVHGYSASEAGMYFGLLQGLMGLSGTLLAGRGFDLAISAQRSDLLRAPGVMFLISTLTTTAALFAPSGWMAIALMVPNMFATAYLLPWAFGASHLVAGPGKQALASSLVLIGSGLLGPALGPLFVGMISDSTAAAQIPNGVRFGLLLVPIATLVAGATILVANKQLEDSRKN